MEIPGLPARRMAHGPVVGAEEVVEIVLLARQPVEHPGDVVPVVELVFGRMHLAAVEGAFEVVEVVEAEIGLDDPVPLRRHHAPVEVLEHIADALGGGRAAPVPDRVGGDENGARRCRGRRGPPDPAIVAHKRPEVEEKMRAGQHFGGAEFEGGVLRIVEYLQVVDCVAVAGAAVAVPLLRRFGVAWTDG